MTTSPVVSPFDKAEPVKWCEAHKAELLGCIFNTIAQGRQAPTFVDRWGKKPTLSKVEIQRTINLFPDQAMARSGLESITIKPTQWWSEGSSIWTPRLVERAEESLSPTSFATAYILSEEPNPATDRHTILFLPEIPHPDQDVRRIMSIYALVRGLAACILINDQHRTRSPLYLTANRTITIHDWIQRFANVAATHPPVSTQHRAYRPDNRFPDDPEQWATAVREELCDYVAAILLGFTYCDLDPLAGRTFTARVVEQWLKARRTPIPPTPTRPPFGGPDPDSPARAA